MGKCMYLRKGETHTAPINGILANTLAVGSTVKLTENNAAVEYLIVHQGLPSSLYDASCDGCWLLRKDIHSAQLWNSPNNNDYANSAINVWLNGDFFNSLGSIEQAAIKQVKIPYRAGSSGSTVNSGANGLVVRAFLLGGYEVGFTTSDNSSFPADGAKLDFFDAGTGTDATNKRNAYLEGAGASWWTRSPTTNSTGYVWRINYSSYNADATKYSNGARQALILPSTALFDKSTLLLKGVA